MSFMTSYFNQSQPNLDLYGTGTLEKWTATDRCWANWSNNGFEHWWTTERFFSPNAEQ